MDDLEAALGHRFADRSLLLLALTHRSLTAEDEGEASNERLEFLGDAVLGLVVAGELFESWDMVEGAMAKVRAAVVDETALAHVARNIGLGQHLRLGKGEEASGGTDKASILSDALEAVIGAIYVDGGFAAARAVVLQHWRPLLEERAAAPGRRDYKTRLQEVLAQSGLVPEYSIAGRGPDHDRRFTAVVSVDGERLGEGEGGSKKRAEQAAARAALEVLQRRHA